ncbi:MAG: right-handed parallel beta-helix repeat-containing protein [Gammaproteobacteria bacterium]|nr:right-handed parallel beta-helix repeat-containing protein [Gammaproteobacteria bacterium]MCP5299357.1 right-handed parallel beta-helix repeat-containing protein [Chromatiaceae bacterium]
MNMPTRALILTALVGSVFAVPGYADRVSLVTIDAKLDTLLASSGGGGDGVVSINQDCAVTTGCHAGDVPGFPVTTIQGQSYRLTSDLDLTSTPDSDAVLLEAETTLDLNGFRIVGGTTCSGTPATCTPAGIGDGITGGEGARVMNGSVVGVGGVGIRLRNRMQVENMLVSECGDDGMQGQCQGCRIVANRVTFNGDRGIHAAFASSQGALIQGNTVAGNNFVGIDSCERCMHLDNAVYANGGFGLRNLGLGGSAYGRNTFYDNNGGGDQVEAGGVEIAPNVCSGNTICP